MNKGNSRILRKAILLQAKVDKELSEYLNDVQNADHRMLERISGAAEGVTKLLDKRFIVDSESPVWSPLSTMNVNEHVKNLKDLRLYKLAAELLVWRSQMAKKRGYLFGTELGYLLELSRLYQEAGKWEASKKILDQQINLILKEDSPDENQIAELNLELSGYYHRKGDSEKAISILIQQMEIIRGNSKVYNTRLYQICFLQLSDIYEKTNRPTEAIRILRSYNPEIEMKDDGASSYFRKQISTKLQQLEDL